MERIPKIRVSTESRPWRRKFSRRSSRDSNPRPFNHESGALTTELSPPPYLVFSLICLNYQWRAGQSWLKNTDCQEQNGSAHDRVLAIFKCWLLTTNWTIKSTEKLLVAVIPPPPPPPPHSFRQGSTTLIPLVTGDDDDELMLNVLRCHLTY